MNPTSTWYPFEITCCSMKAISDSRRIANLTLRHTPHYCGSIHRIRLRRWRSISQDANRYVSSSRWKSKHAHSFLLTRSTCFCSAITQRPKGWLPRCATRPELVNFEHCHLANPFMFISLTASSTKVILLLSAFLDPDSAGNCACIIYEGAAIISLVDSGYHVLQHPRDA
jgi:hypothetical protein